MISLKMMRLILEKREKKEAKARSRYNEKREKTKAILEREGELSLDPNQYYENCLKIENKMKEIK